jgi:hypothetical protein
VVEIICCGRSEAHANFKISHLLTCDIGDISKTATMKLLHRRARTHLSPARGHDSKRGIPKREATIFAIPTRETSAVMGTRRIQLTSQMGTFRSGTKTLSSNPLYYNLKEDYGITGLLPKDGNTDGFPLRMDEERSIHLKPFFADWETKGHEVLPPQLMKSSRIPRDSRGMKAQQLYLSSCRRMSDST